MNAGETTPKALYRRTRGTPAGVWYVRASKPAEWYAERLERDSKAMTGRDVYTASRLREGWLPFWRYQRGTTSFGDRYQTKVMVAIPPDYKLRRVKAKPGYGGSR